MIQTTPFPQRYSTSIAKSEIMLKKPFALVLIAAGLIITPGTALADVIIQQTQPIDEQDGAAISDSVNRQVSESMKTQERIEDIYTSPALRRASCLAKKSQEQGSTRIRRQSNISANNSTSQQTSTMTSSQHRMSRSRAALCR